MYFEHTLNTHTSAYCKKKKNDSILKAIKYEFQKTPTMCIQSLKLIIKSNIA